MWEWRYSSTFLDLGTRWRWVVGFTPCRFTPGERAADTHWIGGWVGPRACLDPSEKRKSFTAGVEPWRYTDSAIPTPAIVIIIIIIIIIILLDYLQVVLL
jgi:hypothetical protein